MSEPRHIVKIAILSHDQSLYTKIQDYDIFGIEFNKSYTQTHGAAFAYSHFYMNNYRLTGQFWMLDANPQWLTVRNLYYKGVAGVLLIVDPREKGASEVINRLLREFISINRNTVPIVVLGFNEKHKQANKKSLNFAKQIERWSGTVIPHLNIQKETSEIKDELIIFMNKVIDWQAKNVIYQTLKIYFSLDAIQNNTRSINKIIQQLRRIYTSRYYDLINDERITKIIYGVALSEGFSVNYNDANIIYKKKIQEDPWNIDNDDYDSLNDLEKPKVKKIK